MKAKTLSHAQVARLLVDLPDRLRDAADAMIYSTSNHRQMAAEALREAAYALDRANRHLEKDMTIDG